MQNNNQKEHRRLSCLDAAEKYEKVESINTQNDLVTASKNWSDKKKTDLFFVFCEFVNVFKFEENNLEIIQKNF